MREVVLVFIGGYLLLWWVVFWLPLRRSPFSVLSFIPATVCAIGVPLIVSDSLMETPSGLLLAWTILPIPVIALEIVHEKGRKRRQNPDATVADAD